MSRHYYEWSPTKPKKGPFQQRLIDLRKGKITPNGHAVSIEELANLLGCSQSYYQRMEAGRYRMKDTFLEKLATYYGIDFSELCQLRLAERLLSLAGFPGNDPSPALWKALEIAEKY